MEEHKALFEPVWQEGMLLLPQHMQFLSRHTQALAWRLSAGIQPFAWGVRKLELESGALEAYRLALAGCEVIFPSGQIGLLPGNMEVPSREFKDLLPQDGGAIQVYLGVRELKEGVANMCAQGESHPQGRYRVRSVDIYDINTGEQARKVEIGELAGRILFEGEDTAGYELVPIARLRQAASGTGAELEPGYVPPLVWVEGWEPFRRKLAGLAGRLKAAEVSLMEVVGTKDVGEVLATGAGLEAVVKMIALGGVGHVVEQMVGMGKVHPVWVYLELVRVWGRLRVFAEGAQAAEVGVYDHMDIGGAFGRLIEELEQVVERMGARGYQRRAFVLRGGRLEVELEPEWVSGRRELYLGVSGAGEPEAVARVAGGWKLVPPGQLKAVLQRRLGGLELKWLARAPVGLPAKPDGAYARIGTGGPLWSSLEQELVLVLSGAESTGWRFDLYVV